MFLLLKVRWNQEKRLCIIRSGNELPLAICSKGLGECQLSLAKSLMDDCRDGGAIDLIHQAIKNLFRYSCDICLECRPSTLGHPHSVSLLFRAAELRPDLSCLWKLLGDACTAVSTVSPNRAQLLVPASLVGLDSNMQNQVLDQAQALKVGERYDRKQAYCSSM